MIEMPHDGGIGPAAGLARLGIAVAPLRQDGLDDGRQSRRPCGAEQTRDEDVAVPLPPLGQIAIDVRPCHLVWSSPMW